MIEGGWLWQMRTGKAKWRSSQKLYQWCQALSSVRLCLTLPLMFVRALATAALHCVSVYFDCSDNVSFLDRIAKVSWKPVSEL